MAVNSWAFNWSRAYVEGMEMPQQTEVLLHKRVYLKDNQGLNCECGSERHTMQHLLQCHLLEQHCIAEDLAAQCVAKQYVLELWSNKVEVMICTIYFSHKYQETFSSTVVSTHFGLFDVNIHGYTIGFLQHFNNAKGVFFQWIYLFVLICCNCSQT